MGRSDDATERRVTGPTAAPGRGRAATNAGICPPPAAVLEPVDDDSAAAVPGAIERRIARDAAAPAVAAWAPMGAEFIEARVRRAMASAAFQAAWEAAEDRRTSAPSPRGAGCEAEAAAGIARALESRPPSLAQDASWTRPPDERRKGIPECAVGERRTAPADSRERDVDERDGLDRVAVERDTVPAAEALALAIDMACAAAMAPGDATD